MCVKAVMHAHHRRAPQPPSQRQLSRVRTTHADAAQARLRVHAGPRCGVLCFAFSCTSCTRNALHCARKQPHCCAHARSALPTRTSAFSSARANRAWTLGRAQIYYKSTAHRVPQPRSWHRRVAHFRCAGGLAFLQDHDRPRRGMGHGSHQRRRLGISRRAQRASLSLQCAACCQPRRSPARCTAFLRSAALSHPKPPVRIEAVRTPTLDGKERMSDLRPSYALIRHASWLYSQMRFSPPASRTNLPGARLAMRAGCRDGTGWAAVDTRRFARAACVTRVWLD